MTSKTKLQCPECTATFDGPLAPQTLGRHRRFKHGIKGTAHASKSTEKFPCPHCDFAGANKSGLAHHLNKKHGDFSQHGRNRKGNQLAHSPQTNSATLAPTNGQAHEGFTDAIPDALVAVASGRFIELCRSVAFEYDLPPRLFAARVAAFIYGSTVRK